MCLTLKLTYQQDKYLSSLYRTRKLKKALKEYIKVAKVDIHVYKQVDISPLGHICAPYRNCIYDGPLISIEEGSTIKIRASGSDDWLNFTVNQGIHAYTKIRSYNTRIYIPCVIPKGTKYVINENLKQF